MTVKLERAPVSASAEVEVSGVEEEEVAILMAIACHLESSMGPATPLIVADALVNVTELKSANVNTPELEEGASTIHSADDRAACDAVWYVVTNRSHDLYP